MFELFPKDEPAKDPGQETNEADAEQEPGQIAREEPEQEAEPEQAADQDAEQAAQSEQAAEPKPGHEVAEPEAEPEPEHEVAEPAAEAVAEPAAEAVAESDLPETAKETYDLGPNYWGSAAEAADETAEPELPEQTTNADQGHPLGTEPAEQVAEPAADAVAAPDLPGPEDQPRRPKPYEWEPEPGLAGQAPESEPEQETAEQVAVSEPKPPAETEPELEQPMETDPEGAVAEYVAESESGPEPEPPAEAEPEPQVESDSQLDVAEQGPEAEPDHAPEADSDGADDAAEPEPEPELASPSEPEPVPMPAYGAATSGASSEPAFDLLIAARPWLKHGRRAWIPLGPGDQPAVTVGESVTPITVAAEHVRDTRVLPVDPRDRAQGKFPPGSRIAPSDARPRRGRGALTEDGTVLYRSSRSRLNVVVGRLREPIYARADATVVSVAPGGIELLLAGQALAGVAGAGQAVHGQLRIAVGDPGDELRPGGLHVADAGSIVVGGARVDVETLTRARALGIHGVIAGGMAGHDLRSFARSEERQRAALHSLPPFAVLVLEGFGRRSLAGPPWDLLLAAAGTSVSIFPEAALLVFDPGAALPEVPTGTIRIAAGPGAGTAGTVDGPALIQRFEEGVHVLAVPFSGAGRRWIVPLGDLERFE